MDSIKERFNSLFPFYLQDTNPSKEEQWIDPKAKALAFIKEELNKLANEIEQGFGKGTKAAVTIIRTQADSI